MAIIALVFLPLLTLEGLEGKLFAPVALTIVLALLSALALALTLIPVLSFYVLKVVADEHGGHHEPWLMRLSPKYAALLNGAFARKGWSFAGRRVAGADGVAYSVTGKTFLPTMDEGSVIVQLTKAPSIALAQPGRRSESRETILGQGARGDRCHRAHRLGRTGLDPMGLNETDSFLKLKPRAQWRVGDKEWVVDQIRKALADLPASRPAIPSPSKCAFPKC
jgi:cobalt-zinc-cadmium resistance protein CzcA